MAEKNASKDPKPMDAGVRETAVGAPSANHPRMCWAMKTLIAEVEALFPEMTYESSGVDGRNTALDITFAVHECPDLERLLECVKTDQRVADVTYDRQEQAVLVSFRSFPRLQDSREPFGLDAAWEILGDESDESDVGTLTVMVGDSENDPEVEGSL